ncbi:uncharacterized protein LOC122304983 [Carya illinoinensis]|uniref:Late embryogenesis abundant protein LEA-2 subgroup domain-containing protein n=1 Tax=Carya illinoinensis TaxID=32201 RepID=A0A8T1R839_CARIL|nr:uncharacterized protein LOC122304983 [Carya illinoinensis]KAG6662251.1 hypothetical protein CIPAW_03G230300 [Carya illinoinensis]KAG6662252.1 hypothetical protein CIPAW_03G230300 [Carya illinoinensis]
MMHAKSDSDVTSLDPSSPRSPKRAVYYVQSPSGDSHDGDKSLSMQPTPVSNSPMESPSHPSYGRHSRASSASRFSGNFRFGDGRKAGRKRNDKAWPECDVIQEEGNYDEFYGIRRGFSRRCQAMIAVFGFFAIFSVFCLILWGASRPYKASVSVKSLTVHNFYFGEGSDSTGVPTKMLTVNCSVKMSVYNPATFFGIHVSSAPVKLMYSEIAVATGQLRKYYQPRKSHRTLAVNLQGNKVPLYGAGGSLALSENNGEVPMLLDFEVKSRGNVVGRLVRSKHRRHVSCSLLIDSHNNKPTKLKENSCTYD